MLQDELLVHRGHFPRNYTTALRNPKSSVSQVTNKRIIYRPAYDQNDISHYLEPQILQSPSASFQPHQRNPPKIKYIQNRFNPHVKRPVDGAVAQPSVSVRPEETVLVAQLLESPMKVPSNEHPGYYENPSYVTLSPVYITTSIPLKSNEVEPYAYYPVGAKLWILPVYFGFAFIAYYGYLLLRFLFLQKLHLSRFRKRDIDVLEFTLQILSSIQKTAELYNG